MQLTNYLHENLIVSMYVGQKYKLLCPGLIAFINGRTDFNL